MELSINNPPYRFDQDSGLVSLIQRVNYRDLLTSSHALDSPGFTLLPLPAGNSPPLF